MYIIRPLGVVALILCAPLPAVAGGSVYIGLGAGLAYSDYATRQAETETNADNNAFASVLIGARQNLGEKGSTNGFFVGAELEALFFDNSYDLDLSGAGSSESGLLAESRVQRKLLLAVGYYGPLIDFYVRGGVYDSLDDGSGGDQRWTVGAGVQSTISGQLSLRADAMARDVGPMESSVFEDRVWDLSVSLVYDLLKY